MKSKLILFLSIFLFPIMALAAINVDKEDEVVLTPHQKVSLLPAPININNQAAVSSSDAILLRGSLAYGNDVQHSNLYQFNMDDPTAISIISAVGFTALTGDCELADANNMWIIDHNTSQLQQIDLATAGVLFSTPMPCPLVDGLWSVLSIHKTTGQFYAIATNGITSVLYEADPLNGTTIELLDLGITAVISGTFDMSGLLYVFDIDSDQIFRIDVDNLLVELVGLAGFDGNYAQGMGLDPNSDEVYLAAYEEAVGSQLRLLDKNTGATTLVASLPGETGAFGIPFSTNFFPYHTVAEVYTDTTIDDWDTLRVLGYYIDPEFNALINFYGDFMKRQVMPPHSFIKLEGLQPPVAAWGGGYLLAKGVVHYEVNPEPYHPEDSLTAFLDIFDIEVLLEGEGSGLKQNRDRGNIENGSGFESDYDRACDSCKFAVLISGGVDENADPKFNNNYPAFWEDLVALYELKVNSMGYCPSNVFVHYFDGTGEDGRIPAANVQVADSAHIAQSHATVAQRVGKCSEEKKPSTFQKMVSNHGTESGAINLLGRDTLKVNDLRSMQQAIIDSCCSTVYDEFTQCFGGYAVDEMRNLNIKDKEGNYKATVYANSAADRESSWGSYGNVHPYLQAKIDALNNGDDYPTAVAKAKKAYDDYLQSEINKILEKIINLEIRKLLATLVGDQALASRLQNEIDEWEKEMEELEKAKGESTNVTISPMKKYCDKVKYVVPAGGQLVLDFEGDKKHCGNVTIYWVDPETGAVKYKVLNWNIDGSAGYSGNNKQRVINGGDDGPTTFWVHNDDGSFKITASANGNQDLAEDVSNTYTYPGASYGTNDGSTDEFMENTLEEIYIENIDQVPFSLRELPAQMGPDHTMFLGGSLTIDITNIYATEMSLHLDLVEVFQPGILHIGSSGSQGYVDVMITEPGEYDIPLGDFTQNPDAFIEMSIFDGSFSIDCWGIHSVYEPIIPAVFAGGDAMITAGEAYALTDATAINYSELLWTTSGDGVFDDPTAINPTYIPGPADIDLGNAELCLTALPLAPWPNPETDCIVLTIHQEIIAAGEDLWLSPGATISFGASGDLPPIPADFFGPGSEPFEGQIVFEGEHSLGGQEPAADLSIFRIEDAYLEPPYPAVPLPVEITGIHLKSREPVNMGIDSFFDVFVEIGLESENWGMHSISKTHDFGGTFTSELIFYPVFTFVEIGKSSNVLVYVSDIPLQFSSPDSYNWTFNPIPGDFDPIGEEPMVLLTEMGSTLELIPFLSRQDFAFVQMDENGTAIEWGGTGYNDGEWYEYPNYGWWNVWFYDHPFDDTREKIITMTFEIEPLNPDMPIDIEIVYNYSTPNWPGWPEMPRPPLPEDVPTIEIEDEMIGRTETIYEFQGTIGIRETITNEFVIEEFNPEWLSIDVMGSNFVLNANLTHVCFKTPPVIELKDFGDAPEAALAYLNPPMTGSFPTCINVPASGWIEHLIIPPTIVPNRAFFGLDCDWEPDGNAGHCLLPNPFGANYNLDECFEDGDAGLIKPGTFTIVGDPGQEIIIPCPNSDGSPIGHTCGWADLGDDIDILVVNNMISGGPAYVNLLIDWNQDGFWGGSSNCTVGGTTDEAWEHALINIPVYNGFADILSALRDTSFRIGPNPGYVWARFSITEAPVVVGWDGSGIFMDGETEDYLFLIEEEEPPAFDFGDAPDQPYPTLFVNNGARHVIDGITYLGSLIDPEPDGQPTVAADGDDLNILNDEDGVTFLWPLRAGNPCKIKVIATGNNALFSAWIDFNANGSWADPVDHVFADINLIAGDNFLTFIAPASATPGNTYARFRYSHQPNLSYTGMATDGEVEDYIIEVDDYGDLKWEQPPDLPGLHAHDGSQIADDWICGGGQVTAIQWWGNYEALGEGIDHFILNIYDDINCMPGTELVSYMVPFAQADETNTGDFIGTLPLYAYNYYLPQAFDQTEGQSYWISVMSISVNQDNPAVWRWCESSRWFWPIHCTAVDWKNENKGWAPLFWNFPAPGQFSDMAFIISSEEPPPQDLDFGDAPDAPYPTLLASDGARHISDGITYLGTKIDVEPDGQPTVAADGDDINNLDDEDGVVFRTPFVAGQDATIKVLASVDGFLNVWLDINQNGSWGDASDHVFVDQALVAGWNTLILPVPNNAKQGNTYMRFRFDSQGGLNYYGLAENGEVEDYLVKVYPENWGFTYTPVTHTVLVPLNVVLNGLTLSANDAIGVFYDNSGVEVCGGAAIWDGTNNQVVLAYGDDLTTPALKEGFAVGETLRWRVYHAATGIEEVVSVVYNPAMPQSDGKFTAYGLSGLLQINGLTATATANPTSICQGDDVQLDVIITGGSGTFTYSWTSTPPGFFSNIKNPTDMPAWDITYHVTVSDGGASANSSVGVLVQPQPVAVVGADATICDTDTYNLNGTAANHSSVLWTTAGDGTFSNPNISNPTYYPGPGDKLSGSAVLTFTANPINPCTAPASASLILTIQPSPMADAGVDDTLCAGESIVLFGWYANASSVLWQTNGDGTFDHPTSLSPTYYPGATDISSGQVDICMMAFPMLPCLIADQSCITLTILESQTVHLFQGWNGLSSYFIPYNASNNHQLFSPIMGNLIIAYNFSGTFWPGSTNTLNWVDTSGYVVKMSADDDMVFCGDRINNLVINLNSNWNIVPVLADHDVDVSSVFDNQVDFKMVMEVANYHIYWPAYGINTIGNMQSGKSYFAFMNTADAIDFGNASPKASPIVPRELVNTSPWNDMVISPTGHVVAFSANACNEFKPGDMVGAFTSSGRCAGMINVESQSIGLRVNGDDPYTPQIDGFANDEPMTYRLYRPESGEQFDLIVVYDDKLDHSGRYHDFALSAITDVKMAPTGIYSLAGADIRIYPNPSHGVFNVDGISAESQIMVYDAFGSLIYSTTTHKPMAINLSAQPAGIYFIQIKTLNGTHYQKIIIN